MYAHGFRGTGNVVWVDEPQLRQYFVDHGYAWAASSYATNGYDPGDGVVDTHDLLEAFPSITGLHPRQAIMTGLSMGGEITTAEIEAYKGDFVGAMPYCGVLAGNDLFDYYLGANVPPPRLPGRCPVGTPGPGDHAQPGDRRADLRHRPDQDRDPVGGHGRATIRRHPARLPECPRLLELLRVRPADQDPVLVRPVPRAQRRHSRVRQRQRGWQPAHLLHLQRPALPHAPPR